MRSAFHKPASPGRSSNRLALAASLALALALGFALFATLVPDARLPLDPPLTIFALAVTALVLREVALREAFADQADEITGAVALLEAEVEYLRVRAASGGDGMEPRGDASTASSGSLPAAPLALATRRRIYPCDRHVRREVG
ncbi:hypothetical protein [Qipengyuania nanhaisediminis]|uniref:hypothetical protein n=1 Tax=Qipengyuania nanhaisediminis TaxID=604088 RepID=UPI0038B2C077